MKTTFLLKAAPLMLSVGLALAAGNAAHAQEFTFNTPTSYSLFVHPGDTIAFSGTVTNDTQLEQIDGVTISAVTAVPGNFTGFTFTSPFFADIDLNQTLNFTGTLKISPTANFTPTFFYLDANGNGDESGESEDLTSNEFKVTVIPNTNPVPEASTTVSLSLLLAMGGLSLVAARRKRVA